MSKTSILILLLMITSFQKENESNINIEIFKCPRIIESNKTKLLIRNDTIPQTANYKLLYVGGYIDTIQLKADVKLADHRRKRLINVGIDSTALIIKVDTNQIITEKSVFDFNDNKDKREIFYEAYPVFLFNTQEDTLYIGSGIVLPIKMEALNKDNQWKVIEQNRFYYCGTGLPKFYLPGNQMFVTSAPKYSGGFKTKLRLRYKNMTSNEFYGSINLQQFNIESDSIRFNKFMIEEQ